MEKMNSFDIAQKQFNAGCPDIEGALYVMRYVMRHVMKRGDWV